MSTKIIGFGGKQYTGWMIYGDEYVYIRNLGADLEEAKRRWGCDEVDMELHGHRYVPIERTAYKEYKEVSYESDCFSYGKYKGEKINKNNDLDYIVWYFNNLFYEGNSERRQNLADRINELNNGRYVYYNDGFFTKDDPWLLIRIKADSMKDAIKSHSEITFDNEKNPDSDGMLYYGDIQFQFESVAKYYYKGFEYYLPVANGKSKRVKGKRITITDYDVQGDVVKINKFEILK